MFDTNNYFENTVCLFDCLIKILIKFTFVILRLRPCLTFPTKDTDQTAIFFFFFFIFFFIIYYFLILIVLNNVPRTYIKAVQSNLSFYLKHLL